MRTPEQNSVLRFLVFSDLHYKKDVNLAGVSDLTFLFARAARSQADFVIHAGDFCNDYIGSPELISEYLSNSIGLPVYGILGNHDLEARGNTIEYVASLLTNQAGQVVWGTSDDQINRERISYYYFDKGPFRIVCADTNYSYCPSSGIWQHNPGNSSGTLTGNLYGQSLGPVQLSWLEAVLTEAAGSGKKCIVFSHESINPARSMYSPDAEAVQSIFHKVNSMKRGTVLMAINGHTHSNRPPMIINNILFFEVNSARIGYWIPGSPPHYSDVHTFTRHRYNEDGSVAAVETSPLSSLLEGNSTWFFDRPLSAVVTVHSDGEIGIEGMQAEWVYGVAPENVPDFISPQISGGTFRCL